MKIALFIAGLVIASTVQAAGLDYYKEGAICDKKGGFCADFMGVSVGITKMYLGDKAEKKLMAEINKVGLEDFDATTFTMPAKLRKAPAGPVATAIGLIPKQLKRCSENKIL
jgi:hypothetical protein